MKLQNILSTDLPEIDNSIKECINLGQWLLFKSETQTYENVSISFYLKVDQSFFGLDDKGFVVIELKSTDPTPKIQELVYFSDLPKPSSLSNMRP